MANMATYLSTKVADYTATELTIASNGELKEEGQKKQYYHEYDGGSIEVVTASESFFTVTLSWTALSFTDAATILDLYHDPNKANAQNRSFYWVHPVDGVSYVARFTSDLTQTLSAHLPSRKASDSVVLQIEGVKA